MTEKEKKEETAPETAAGEPKKDAPKAEKKAAPKKKADTKPKTAKADKAKAAEPEKDTEKAVPKEESKSEPKAEKKAAPPKEKKKAAAPKEITVTLIRSSIGRPKDQKRTLVGLGFKKLNQSRVLKDTPAIRGMIRKVSHLVEVK